MLFEEKHRSYQGPKTYVEGDFEYLDRSARKEAENVREFLNKWILWYPEHEARELISRIKSRNRHAFNSATFEIILYAIINSLGGKLEIHPELENGSYKRPDFLVKMPKGEEFYLEAVLASEFSEAEISAEKRKNVVLHAIEKLETQNFFLGINAKGNPDTPPSGKTLCRELNNWLRGLDPDVVAKNVEEKGPQQLPRINWEHDGWDIEFEAIPINPESRGKGQRVIGVQLGGVRWVNVWEPIRDAIRAKGGKYGELKKPFIVAVNVDAICLDRIDEMQALFGEEEYLFNLGNPTDQPEMRRAANGAWFGLKGAQYTRVSGAWLFGGMNPWNIVSRKNTLYFNPWSQFSVPAELRKINHAIVNREKMEWIEAKKLSSLLQLSDNWPE